MDPTSSTPETLIAKNIEMNGDSSSSEAVPASGSSNTTNSAAAAEVDVSNNQAQPTTYDDLFPSLPTSRKGPGAKNAGNPIGEWNKKPILQSSTVTQVMTIPMAERRAAGGGGSFGADDSSKTLKAVMDKSGAKIEMSSSRDQSLTFLITGKQDAVLKARRELFAQFQVI